MDMTSQFRSAIMRKLWQGIKLVLVLAAIGFGIYWFRFSPLPVTPHRIERGQVVAEVMGTGTLEARVRATISPKIPGRIEEVLADQGDRVTKGDLLVRLDDDELTQQVEIAQAALAASKAAVERLKTDRGRGRGGAGQAGLSAHAATDRQGRDH
jgi:HlyD family secretion protein